MNLKKLLEKDDNLLKDASLFMVGSGSVAVFNYLYHFFSGRLLGPHDYGVLGSLFALVYLVMISSSTMSTVISRFSAKYKHSKDQLTEMIHSVFFGMAFISFIGMMFFFMLVPRVASYLHLESRTGLYIVGMIGYSIMILSILNGALNGLQKFLWQNTVSFTVAFLKFSLGVGLVYLGFGVEGALLGIFVATLIGLLLGIFALRKVIVKRVKLLFELEEVIHFAVPVLFSTILSILLITIDQIMVKHYFSSNDAGHYAAAGMISKIILYGSGFFVAAVFPKMVSATKHASSQILRKSLVYTLTLSGIGAGIFFIFPEFIVHFFYGPEYFDVAPIIGIFGLAMALYAGIQILVIYNLAHEKFGFVFLLLIGVLVEIVAISNFHQTLYGIVKIFLGVNIIILLGLLVFNREDLGGKYKK